MSPPWIYWREYSIKDHGIDLGKKEVDEEKMPVPVAKC